MKKLLSIVLALALALSLSVTAFAAGDDTGDGTDTGTTTQGTTIQPGTNGEPSPSSGDTQVNYSVAPAYTVTIPASVTIGGENGSNTVTVSAEGVKVAKGKQVVVKLTGINESTDEDGNTTSDTTFTVKTAEGASLTYTVQKGSDTIQKDGTVLTVASGLNNETGEDGTTTGASTGSAALTFALNDTVQYAGDYTGTVTFTVSVDEVPETTP